MLKITGEDGKTLYKIEDDATEPEVVSELPKKEPERYCSGDGRCGNTACDHGKEKK